MTRMSRPTPSVVWVGRAARAELAVACTTCGATIGEACITTVFKDLPHRPRADYAETLGFRDVPAVGLFA